MNFSVGIDIEHTDRFQNIDSEYSDQFLHKTFTDRELQYCFNKRNPHQHLAGRFAAKEAAFKALEQIESAKNPHITQIEIIQPEGSDFPKIDAPGTSVISSLSISHTTDIAIAFVMMLEEDEEHNDR